MSSPNFPEADRETHLLWPADARIRNLTYGCNLYTDVSVRIVELDERGNETDAHKEVEYEQEHLVSAPTHPPISSSTLPCFSPLPIKD